MEVGVTGQIRVRSFVRLLGRSPVLLLSLIRSLFSLLVVMVLDPSKSLSSSSSSSLFLALDIVLARIPLHNLAVHIVPAKACDCYHVQRILLVRVPIHGRLGRALVDVVSLVETALVQPIEIALEQRVAPEVMPPVTDQVSMWLLAMLDRVQVKYRRLKDC